MMIGFPSETASMSRSIFAHSGFVRCLAAFLSISAAHGATAVEPKISKNTHIASPTPANIVPKGSHRDPDRLQWLEINGENCFTDELLVRLRVKTNGLSLPALTELPDDLAALFARYPGDLALDSLMEIRPRAAWMLSTPRDSGHHRLLCLNGLTRIDHQSAEAFASHAGGLALDGLETVDLPTARLLCRTEGVLSLRGLVSLTLDEALCFANRTGLTYLPAAASLPPDVREQLQENQFVRFSQPSLVPHSDDCLPKEIGE
jgi:hypothetical protein